MDKSTIRKRLHISGLTPAITVTDVEARLRGFGDVLALDGFGALDAVGQPRRFGYVTLEATESSLKRCVSALSGTMWKGAKLRIGEAKPDYAQRLEIERKHAAEMEKERPLKRRRLPRGVHGIHSNDMSPVTVENMEKHSGWHKTALSHLIRPMKMRPSHPLSVPTQKVMPGDGVSRLKRSRKPNADGLGVPTRARLHVIDPRLYGQVHLRENMLDVIFDTQPTKPHSSPPPPPSSAEVNVRAPPPDFLLSSVRDQVAQVDVSSVIPDPAEEKRRDLGLLTAMFGDDASDWGGKESLDSDIDFPVGAIKNDDLDLESDDTSKTMDKDEPDLAGTVAPAEKPQTKSLKDMFKPQEEEAGFSLLAGLGDIDIDPNFDVDLGVSGSAPGPGPTPVHVPLAVTVTHPFNLKTPSITLDPTLPFFFPQPDNPRAKDLFTIARAEGWEFGRSGDTETIRQRWDSAKSALTREWKKRSREAVKARRRRHGAVEGEDA